MSNTLTNLIPDIYAALDVVSRELVGFIPSVARNAKADRVALNQEVVAFQTPANSGGGTLTPAMSIPSAADQTIGNVPVTISKQEYRPFSWTGEEQYSMDTGPGFLSIQQDQIAQAIRSLVNEMETDVATAIYKGASRAYGTPGTTPFSSNFNEIAQLKKILDDNGAPASDRHLVIDTAAGANLRNNAQLTKVNEAGSSDPVRRGVLLDVHGFQIRESAQVQTHTKGTGSGYLVDLTAGYSAASATVHVDTGTGTILAGDLLVNGTTGTDTNKYVVGTGFAGDGDGDIVLAKPGLQAAWANNDPLTIQNSYTANVAFRRSAAVFVERLPMLPKEGDLGEHMIVTDPMTGLSFDFAWYPGTYMGVYWVTASWGVKVIKPEHIAILAG